MHVHGGGVVLIVRVSRHHQERVVLLLEPERPRHQPNYARLTVDRELANKQGLGVRRAHRGDKVMRCKERDISGYIIQRC